MLETNARPPRDHVLLIGIDAYDGINPLQGCVNDIDVIQRILIDKLGIAHYDRIVERRVIMNCADIDLSASIKQRNRNLITHLEAFQIGLKCESIRSSQY